MLTIYATAAAVAVASHSAAILVFWLFPRLLAEPYMRFVRMSEHVGRPVNCASLLENTRSMCVAAPFRQLAWNMPYHGEHHLAPSVPFHALPALHREVSAREPGQSTGYFGAHREILQRVAKLRSPPASVD